MTRPGIAYDPANWYWLVGDKSPAAQVYSSAADAYVPLTDPTYLVWLSAGGTPTTITTEQSLSDVLSAAGQPLPPAAITSDAQKNILFDAIPKVIQVWAFAVDNRVRVLEGQPTRTAAQFKTYVKSLLT